MTNNKEVIKKLRDNAELAWAAYGYFHLADNGYKHNDKDEERRDYFPKLLKHLGEEERDPTYTDILDITYKYYLDKNGKPKDSWYNDKLFDGEFGKEQAKKFFERYKLITHQENTDSGFSATLFEDKGEIDKSTGERKVVPKDSKYILAFSK